MRIIPTLSTFLLLAACQSQEADAPTARTMRDDLGGRFFFIQSDGRHDGKRTILLLTCHGDGDNGVMFQTLVTPAAPPAGTVAVDYVAGPTKGRAEVRWTGKDLWTVSDSGLSQRLARAFLQSREMTVRFPDQTGAPHSATWRRETAADLEQQLKGWCLA